MSAVRGVTATRPLHTVMSGVETDRRPSGVRPESREISFFLYVLEKQIRVLKGKFAFS